MSEQTQRRPRVPALETKSSNELPYAMMLWCTRSKLPRLLIIYKENGGASCLAPRRWSFVASQLPITVYDLAFYGNILAFYGSAFYAIIWEPPRAFLGHTLSHKDFRNTWHFTKFYGNCPRP